MLGIRNTLPGRTRHDGEKTAAPAEHGLLVRLIPHCTARYRHIHHTPPTLTPLFTVPVPLKFRAGAGIRRYIERDVRPHS
jgi:hypothetical protein